MTHSRQYGNRLKGAPTIYQRVEQALIDGGQSCGEFHHSHGYESGTPYIPPVDGYVIDVSYIGELYVDHAGKGRKAALPGYAAALEAAGYHPRIESIDAWQPFSLRKKEVVWTGIWDERFAARRRAAGDYGGDAEPEDPLCPECARPIGDDDGCCRCGEREARARQAAYRRGLGV